MSLSQWENVSGDNRAVLKKKGCPTINPVFSGHVVGENTTKPCINKLSKITDR